MKVACQQCGASYSVADDKVAGRRLKLRCKKCGEPMLIEGSQELGDLDEPVEAGVQVVGGRPSTMPEDDHAPAWYVAIGDSAQGPFTLDAVIERCADGGVTADTLVFHDGLADWTPAVEVPELAEALSGARPARGSALPPEPPPAARTRKATPVAPIESMVAMGGDPFGEPAPSPRVSGEELASGSQREGTVQFSLEDIRALSLTTTPSLAPAPASKAGYASGEGSGLIDMRSLIESASESGDVYKPIGDLRASPLDTMAPLSLPASGRRGGVDFRTKVFAGVAAFSCLLAGVVGVLALTRAPQPVQPAVAAAVQPVAEAPPAVLAQGMAEAAAEEPAAEEPAAEEPAAEEQPAEAAAEAEPREDDERGDEREVATERARRPSKRKGARAERKPEQPARAASAKGTKTRERGGVDVEDILAGAPAEKKASAKKAGGGNSIDDLLLGALNDKDAKKPAASKSEPPKAESSLPKTPTREQMLSALGRAKAKAARCKGSGVATAAITIAGPKGRASKVSVSGVDGAAKSCIEKAVRSTPFPKFQQESFAVSFPFKLSGG